MARHCVGLVLEDNMRYHFAITAEPVPAFCRMACLWAWSLRRYAGALANSHIFVIFNDRTDPATEKWLRRLPNLTVLARPRLSHDHKELNKYSALWAPGLEKADYVILTDCDVICANRLDELEALMASAAFGGISDNPISATHGTYKPSIYRYARMLHDLAGLSPNEIRAHRHAAGTSRPPYDGLPYFNGGVLVIGGRRLAEFRALVVELSRRIHRQVYHDQKHPLGLMRRTWNALCARWPGGERLMIGWHVRRKRFADQAAVFPAVLKLRLPYRVLPHEFNWRHHGTGRPEETPRLIHYYKSALGIPPPRILQADWIHPYQMSNDIGQHALARVVSEFLQQHPEYPHRTTP